MSRSKRGSLVVQLASLVLSLSGSALAKQDLVVQDVHEAASMKLEPGTLLNWMMRRNAQAEALSDLALAPAFGEAPFKGAQAVHPPHLPHPPSLDLSNLMALVPPERDQGSCQNCYAWAGTGAMEIALTVQRGFSSSDRLSVQYYNSCRCEAGVDCLSCHPMDLQEFVSWYNTSRRAIPWSNVNASFEDEYQTEWSGSTVECRAIDDTTRKYPVEYVEAEQIDTVQARVSDAWIARAVAIAKIKDVLNMNRGVVFSMHMPSQSDFEHFLDWWKYGRDSDVLDVDQYCVTASTGGGAGTSQSNVGHSMLIVGYDDDPNDPYWLVLNSLGTPGYRQNGMFRMRMNMDYRCQVYDKGVLVPARWFDALDVRYGNGNSI